MECLPQSVYLRNVQMAYLLMTAYLWTTFVGDTYLQTAYLFTYLKALSYEKN